jgi:4-amino-4-deoxy-L-arabinose transferase-like glycosyltransferase
MRNIPQSAQTWGQLERPYAGVACIALFWAIVFVPLAGFPSLHLEEGTHATLAKDMMLRHHWLTPQLLGALPYYNKPPMLPWLMAACAQMLGELDEWAVRLPALLATLATAVMVYWTIREDVTQRAALLAAAAAMLTPSIMLVASVGETDVLATAFSFAAFAVFLKADRAGAVGAPHWIFCGLLMGAAALTKGPIPLLFPAGGIALFRLLHGPRRELAGLAGAVIVAAAVLAVWLVPNFQPGTPAIWWSQMKLDDALHPGSVWAGGATRLLFLLSVAVVNLPTLLLALPALLPRQRAHLGIPPRLAGALGCYALAGTAALALASAAKARYAMPVTPALAAAAGLAFEPLCGRIRRLFDATVVALVVLTLFQVIRSDVVAPLRSAVLLRNRQVGEAIDAAIGAAPAPLLLFNSPFDMNCLFYLKPATEDLITAASPASGPAWILLGDAGPEWPDGMDAAAAGPPRLDMLSRDNEPFRLFRFESFPSAPDREK